MSLLEQHNFSATNECPIDAANSALPICPGLNSSALNSDTQSYYAARLNSLISEHDDLDQAVASLICTAGCDDLVISRIKKRKLYLKDEISHTRVHLRLLIENVA